MSVVAASEAVLAARRQWREMGACKTRANCLKPTEIYKSPARFDLRDAPNCLKVEMIATMGARHRRPAKFRAYTMASMILDSETKAVESDHGEELRLLLRVL